ncbi:MAG: YgiQ family radical SAM protein [Candidatus Mucispirillum faecigallinarum]|nr:YgiQ family radical SAM protein [Candidatus Mucispirillum faecigallinarum]
MFLPISMEEVKSLGWDYIDVILVTGDAYIDSPFSGTAVIGKYLLKHGFRTAVISQPAIDSDKDITVFGEPRLFWGISAGCVDSMVANYTAAGKPRKMCDFTPNGINNKRPDRASIVYTGLIRRFFKNTKPIVLGGIEASLRRIAHYDFKTDKIRRSILFDAKADYIIYGMGEVPVLEFARALQNNEDVKNIKGLCYISKELCDDAIILPSFDEVSSDKNKFHQMFKIFSDNSEAQSAKKLAQKTGDRYLIQNPPAYYDDEILDEVSDISFERAVHPKINGKVKALETIKTSVISHRGCFGGCSFCAIAVHQGRRVISRSISSIIKEVESITKMKGFNGIISDLGGPTGNMYMMKCKKMEKLGACTHKSCLYPNVCASMNIDHKPILNLLEKVGSIKGVKKVFATSGIRADLAVNDKLNGKNYIAEIAKNHVSGQLKMAPESADSKVLKAMKKPDNKSFLEFCRIYKEYSKKFHKNQFISCYFIAAHPGENEKEAQNTHNFIEKYLDFSPEQVQIFTPTPSTWATCAYYTGLDEEGNKIYAEKQLSKKEKYKSIIMGKSEKVSKK